ncbi:MAG: AAA family ATPase [Gammaproteobacteria bacterium]|nr:AAA family ATPase [Gammaproteobacteria bacterium]MYD80841.1 AAA family ATPase [Gammaproteobacteria bacterium]
MLVLAGAGSGKTRVLVHRIAWLIERCGASPYEVLAVTFTNKAASEMRTRTENLLNFGIGAMWIGTFHGLANRLLRIHWKEAELPRSFEVIDAADQLRLVKRLVKEADLDPDQFPAKDVVNSINKWKEEGQRPRHVFVENSRVKQIHLDLYIRYQELTNAAGLVDFAELLLRSHELWLENKELLAQYRQRFRYILVDEFQDTNGIQFAWIQMLVGNDNFVMAVGDDDQSIYGWRGARLANILEFEKQFQDVKVIRLEQNYRSTQTILNAANALIKHNGQRLDKTLWTDAGRGDPIRIFSAHSEFEEARYVVDKCQQWMNDRDFGPNDIGILYRNNAQSRVLEQEFSQRNVPYRIYGGTRFYDRMEIRDAVGYMKLIHDSQSDIAYERVVNTPPRGIGAKTLELVRAASEENNTSLWEATQRLVMNGDLKGRAKLALQRFVELIESLRGTARGKTLEEIARIAAIDSGLWDYHGKESGETGRARRENLEELVSACAQFAGPAHLPVEGEEDNLEQNVNEKLRNFLDQAMLDAGEYQATTHDAINMMTVHSAKGLEFPVVFIVGLEEDLFPHNDANGDFTVEEEERRLAYVGITRSMRLLYLSHASSRTRFGQQHMRCIPSRFLKELPKQDVSYVRRSANPHWRTGSQGLSADRSTRNTSRSDLPPMMQDPVEPNHTKWQIGSEVSHSRFGIGTIVNTRGRKESLVLEIEFSESGRKWLVAETPHLQVGVKP